MREGSCLRVVSLLIDIYPFFFLSFLFGLEGYEWWWGDNFFLGDWYCDLLLEHYELKSVIVFIANYFEISK